MKTIVVGGGAAGMMAAIFAAYSGDEVTLIEKNEKLGKKVYITGKGRCNLTNACDDNEFFENVITNPKFLYSAYYGFTSADVMSFFEKLGLKIKTERGNRVFPLSDHSSDVTEALRRELKRLKVEILLNTKVTGIVTDNACCRGVFVDDKSVSTKESSKKQKSMYAGKVILATGGMSYKSCGACKDTWKFAKELSIESSMPEPSLVPMTVKEEYVRELQGLSLKNVSVLFKSENKKVYEDFGEMLFTHFGLSGPIILSASAHIREKAYGNNLKISIDLKPALSKEELDKRILKDFSKYSNKQFINSLSDLLPMKIIPVIVRLSGIDGRKAVNLITKEERKKLTEIIKDFEFTITGNRGFDEAIITRGGISVKEINPSTMESKKYRGLFFAGEMIDVDALTGGFNLQIAWATGKLAGENCTVSRL